jgi:hypothetical protein
MQDDKCDYDTQSFILRIWVDTPSAKGKIKAWRGSIVHVGSGKRIYFHNLNSITPFIQRQTGMGYGAFRSWLKSIFFRDKQK